MNFKIIRAKKENAHEMALLHAISWEQAYSGIIPENIINDFTIEKREKIFSSAISSNPEEYYIFKVDDNLAGIASLNKSHEKNAPDYIGEIYSIYFHPKYWGTPATYYGLQFCVDRLKTLGFKTVTIWVLNDNIRAKKFYEKNGFIPDGNYQEMELGKKLLEIRYSKNIV